MSGLPGSSSRTLETWCSVRVSHTFENLYAHVDLDGDPEINPGDRVVVHGSEINPPFGAVVVERRRATLTRASWILRTWTRLTGDLDCLSLLDVSFSDRRTL